MGSLGVSAVWLRRSGLWEGTSEIVRCYTTKHCTNYDFVAAIAFAFTSSSTLPLYVALKGSVQPISTKTPKYRSFRILCLSSVATAILLILPLVFFSASPNRPVRPFLPLLPPYLTLMVEGNIYPSTKSTPCRSIRLYLGPPHSLLAYDHTQNINSHVYSALDYCRFPRWARESARMGICVGINSCWYARECWGEGWEISK
jgi:hypothetical protein